MSVFSDGILKCVLLFSDFVEYICNIENDEISIFITVLMVFLFFHIHLTMAWVEHKSGYLFMIDTP